MYGFCNQFFTCTAFAPDQYSIISYCKLFNNMENFPHLYIPCNNVFKSIFMFQIFIKELFRRFRNDFMIFYLFDSRVHWFNESLLVDWFKEIVKCSIFHSRNGKIDICYSCEYNGFNINRIFIDMFKNIKACYLWHIHIKQQNIILMIG